MGWVTQRTMLGISKLPSLETPLNPTLLHQQFLASTMASRLDLRKPIMKILILILCPALAMQALRAEPLSDADRETLLENLDKLKDGAEATLDARFRLAIAAYRNAMTSDAAAVELFLNCTEKVNFKDEQMKAMDFREWRRNQDEKLSDPALGLALRHQLRWLVLTLQAASEGADRAKLAVEAQNIVDTIFSNPEKLSGQAATLSQSVTTSVFAQAYDINSVKVEKWPLSPIQLEQIYTEILLPPYQKPGSTSQLRAAWIKRIQQEKAKVEHIADEQRRNGSNNRNDKREEKRIGMASELRSPEVERFVTDIVPNLMWDMEMDLFTYGDQTGAAVRMLAHLEKHISHSSAREWGEELRKALSPPAPKIAETVEQPAP
jgi:hypothetical protein